MMRTPFSYSQIENLLVFIFMSLTATSQHVARYATVKVPAIRSKLLESRMLQKEMFEEIIEISFVVF